MSYQPPSDFQKAGMTESWNYKELGAGAIFYGVYRYKEEHVGENDATIYTFQSHGSDKFNTPDKLMSIWSSSILTMRFKNFEPGEQVVVEYLGEKPSPNRKGKTYHDFNVYHRPAPLKKVADNGEDDLEEFNPSRPGMNENVDPSEFENGVGNEDGTP